MVDDFLILPVTWPVDFDYDRDVDLPDFALFQPCIAGPDVGVVPGGCTEATFASADLDGDEDVDLNDIAAFQGLFTGEPNCGNGSVEGMEYCDDGGETAVCDVDCTWAQCGDLTLNPLAGEECDEGWETVECDLDCTIAYCGDGTTNETAGEECDDEGESYDCDANCTDASCGDGDVNETRGEECDDEGPSETCDWDCTFAECGDGTLNTLAGEACDPPDGIHCDGECQWICGDGVVQPGEDCDPPDGVTCDAECQRIPTCGDGILDEGEECDDGEETADCDDDCTFPECGDGNLNYYAGEECDDGNNESGDGCSAECQTEGPLPTCTIDFDGECPSDDVVCGTLFEGDGGCRWSPDPLCIDTWPRAWKLTEYSYTDIIFLGDVTGVSFVFTASYYAYGDVQFLDADYNTVGWVSTQGGCEYQEPSVQVLTFDPPARYANIYASSEEQGAVWLDTMVINP